MLDCYSPVHEVSAKLTHEPINFLVRFPLLAFVRPAEPLAGTASRILPSSGFSWADHVDSAGLSRLSETSVAEFSLRPSCRFVYAVAATLQCRYRLLVSSETVESMEDRLSLLILHFE